MKLRDEPCAEELWNEITRIFISWLRHITCVTLSRSRKHFRVLYHNSYWCHQGSCLYLATMILSQYTPDLQNCWVICTQNSIHAWCSCFFCPRILSRLWGLGRFLHFIQIRRFISCQKIPLIALGMVNCTSSHCIQEYPLSKYLTLAQMSNYIHIYS